MAQHKEEKKKKTPSNWMAEIEVPLGMKYVLSWVLTFLPGFYFCVGCDNAQVELIHSGNISKYRRFFWTVFFTVGLYHSINVISNNAKKYFDYPVNIRRVTPPGELTAAAGVDFKLYYNFSSVHVSRYHSLPEFNAFKIKNITQVSLLNGGTSILLWTS